MAGGSSWGKNLILVLPLGLFAAFILTLNGTLCYVFKSLSKTGVGNLCFKVQFMSKLSCWKIALSAPDKLFFRRSLKVSDLHWSVKKFVSGICKGPSFLFASLFIVPPKPETSVFLFYHILWWYFSGNGLKIKLSFESLYWMHVTQGFQIWEFYSIEFVSYI